VGWLLKARRALDQQEIPHGTITAQNAHKAKKFSMIDRDGPAKIERATARNRPAHRPHRKQKLPRFVAINRRPFPVRKPLKRGCDSSVQPQWLTRPGLPGLLRSRKRRAGPDGSLPPKRVGQKTLGCSGVSVGGEQEIKRCAARVRGSRTSSPLAAGDGSIRSLPRRFRLCGFESLLRWGR
jgi:hypothetical protein